MSGVWPTWQQNGPHFVNNYMAKPTVPRTLWRGKETCQFNPEYENTDIFYSDVKMCKDILVVDRGPKNPHRILYEKALEHVHDQINAVDVGCRDGEFTRYLSWSFNHVRAFDYRKRILFAMNIDTTKNKVSHYTCALGEHNATEYASGRGNFRSSKVIPKWHLKPKTKIYTLDYFNFQDVNLMKIDVDGMDGEVIKGGMETIKRCKPVIIIEEISSTDGVPNHDGVALLKKIGYKIVYTHKSGEIGRHTDHVMVL